VTSDRKHRSQKVSWRTKRKRLPGERKAVLPADQSAFVDGGVAVVVPVDGVAESARKNKRILPLRRGSSAIKFAV